MHEASVAEGALTDGGECVWKAQVFKRRGASECEHGNLGQPCANRDACESAAVIKGAVPHRRDAVGNVDASDPIVLCECISPDGGECVGQRYVGDITVVVCECVLCQGGYGHGVNRRWDHNRSAAVILVLAASDGDFTAVVGVNEPVADLIPIVS